MIKFDERNYRKHSDRNKELINKSLKECGAGRSIVIDNEDNIIAGNGIYEQAQKLGLKTKVIETDGSELVVVKRTDLATDDDKRKQLAVMDNSTSDSSEFDFELLNSDFETETLQDWGLDVADFSLEEEKEIIEDEVPEVVETKCKKGDIWQLGEHRLMCGDSTLIDDVEKLMNGNKADIAFTSPPYNAGKTATEQKMQKNSKYANDNDDKTDEDYLNLLFEFTMNSLEYCEYSFVNIQSLSNNKIALIDYLYQMKYYYADTIIWDKINGQPAMANNVLNSVFEYIHVFSHKHNRAIGVKDFRGTLDNIIHISKQNKNEFSKIHNATFPLKLAEYFINNFSLNSVLDLFGGTGTTLIACEQLNRKCYIMELDEYYCDVIIQRWENLTGKKAELING